MKYFVPIYCTIFYLSLVFISWFRLHQTGLNILTNGLFSTIILATTLQLLKWKKDKLVESEVFLNILLFLTGIWIGFIYASPDSENKELYVGSIIKGTFFVSFFGAPFLRIVAAQNRSEFKIFMGKEIGYLKDTMDELIRIIRVSPSNDDTKVLAEDTVEKLRAAAKATLDKVEEKADEKFEKQTYNSVDVTNLSIDGLIKFQSSFFPVGFPTTGIRKQEVIIASNLGTISSKFDVKGFVPTKPKEIVPKLEILLSEWNNNFKSLMSKSDTEKITAIAKFHHDFLVIHPFLDGNGRVAKSLLKSQIEELLGKKIDTQLFTEFSEKYNKALITGNGGKLAEIINFINLLISY